MNIYHVMDEIKNSGYGGQELMIDSFVLGVQVGRQQIVDLREIVDLVKKLRLLKNKIDYEYLSHFRRDELIHSFLNDPYSNLSHLLSEITIKEQIICPICRILIIVDDESSFKLRACGHFVHTLCLVNYGKEVQKSKQNISCPACSRDLDKLDSLEIQNTQLDESYYSTCPTIGCKNDFIFQEFQTSFMCHSCMKKYCLKCKNNWHEGKCQVNNNNLGKLPFQQGDKFRSCQKCNQWVQRNDDSQIVQCVCNHSFCFDCGSTNKKCNCTNKPIFIKRIINRINPFGKNQ